MKLNKLTLALATLFTTSLSVYAAPELPTSFTPKETAPDVSFIFDPVNGYTNAGQKLQDRLDECSGYCTAWIGNAGKEYIANTVFTDNGGKPTAEMYNTAYSVDNTIHYFQLNLNSNSVAIRTTVTGVSFDSLSGSLTVLDSGKAYDTTVEQYGQLSIRDNGEAYNSLIKADGLQTIGKNGYAQNNIIDGGEQRIYGDAEDSLLINGAEQYLWEGTSRNTHIGAGSYQLASGLSLETKVYSGGYQLVYSGKVDIRPIADRDSTIYLGGTQRVQNGASVNTQVYGEQIIDGRPGSWTNGSWGEGGRFSFTPEVHNATIHAGGTQLIEKDATAIETILNGGTQFVNANGKSDRTTINSGTQIVNASGIADLTTVNGGEQIVNEFGKVSNTTIQNAGQSTINFGGYSYGTLEVADGSLTMQGGDDSHTWSELAGTKGAYAEQVNLSSAAGQLFVAHNDATAESVVTIGSLTSAGGVINFGRQDGSDAGKFSRLELDSLTGSGTIVMNTNIQNGTSDFLHVEQTIADPDMFKVIVNDSGTELEEYRHHIISAGVNSLSDTFTMHDGFARADAGVYMVQYTLEHSSDSTNAREDWHLVATPAVNPGPNPDPGPNPGPGPTPPITTPTTDAVLAMANTTPTIVDAELSTLRQRLGDLDNNAHNNGVWGKYITSQYKVEKETGAAYKQDMNGFVLGADRALEKENGTLHLGVMGGYSKSDIDFKRGGDGKVDSYSFGIYATYMSDSGLYVDGVAKYNYFKHKTDARMTNGSIASGKYNVSGASLSLELGKKYERDNLFSAPYVMVSSFYAGKTDYTLSNGMKANIGRTSSVKGEIGNVLGKNFNFENGNIKPYLRTAVTYELVNSNRVKLNDKHEFNNDMSGAAMKVGVGATAKLGNNFDAYAEVNYMKATHIKMPYSGHIGVRYSF